MLRLRDVHLTSQRTWVRSTARSHAGALAIPHARSALYALVIDRLNERREVADARTSVVYEHIRRPVLERLSNPTA